MANLNRLFFYGLFLWAVSGVASSAHAGSGAISYSHGFDLFSIGTSFKSDQSQVLKQFSFSA